MRYLQKIIITMLLLLFSINSYADDSDSGLRYSNSDIETMTIEDMGLITCNAIQVLGVKADKFDNINQQELDNHCSTDKAVGDYKLNLDSFVYTLIKLIFFNILIIAIGKFYWNKINNRNMKASLISLVITAIIMLFVMFPINLKDSQDNNVEVSLFSMIITDFALKDFLSGESVIQSQELEVFDKYIHKGTVNFRTDDIKSFTNALLPVFAHSKIDIESFDYNIYETDKTIKADFIIGSQRFVLEEQKDLEWIKKGESIVNVDYASIEVETFKNEIQKIVKHSVDTAMFISTNYVKGSDAMPVFEKIESISGYETISHQCPAIYDTSIFNLNGVEYKELNKYMTFTSFCMSKQLHESGFSKKQFVVDDGDNSKVGADEFIKSVQQLCKTSFYDCASSLEYAAYVNDIRNSSKGLISLINEPFLNEQKNIPISTVKAINRFKVGNYINLSWGFGDYEPTGTSIHTETITFNADLKRNEDLGYLFSLGAENAYDLLNSANAFLDSVKSIDEYAKDVINIANRPMRAFKYCLDYPNRKIQVGNEVFVNGSGVGCLSEFRRSSIELSIALKGGLLASKATKNATVQKTMVSATSSLGKLTGDKVSSAVGAVMFFYGMSDNAYDAFNTGSNSFGNAYGNAYVAYLIGHKETGATLLGIISEFLYWIYILCTVIVFTLSLFAVWYIVKVLIDKILLSSFGLLALRKQGNFTSLIETLKYITLISLMSMTMTTISLFIVKIVRDQVIMLIVNYIELPDVADFAGFGDLGAYIGSLGAILITLLAVISFASLYQLQVFMNMLGKTIFNRHKEHGEKDIKEKNLINSRKLSKQGVNLAS